MAVLMRLSPLTVEGQQSINDNGASDGRQKSICEAGRRAERSRWCSLPGSRRATSCEGRRCATTRESASACGITQWDGLEYYDLVIPLTISIHHWRHTDYVAAGARQVQPLIRASLEDASRAGWRTDEPTDFATLFSRARVRTKNSFRSWRVSSVTIRLTRASRPVRSV
jgi:hypothetical protein